MKRGKYLYETPSQIVFVKMKDNDSKRHKSRCLFYNSRTGLCMHHQFKCYGSSHCDSYDEKEIKTNNFNITPSPKKSTKQKITNTIIDVENFKKVNTFITHKTWGRGKIIGISEKHINVEFDSGQYKTLDLNFCVEEGLISIVD